MKVITKVFLFPATVITWLVPDVLKNPEFMQSIGIPKIVEWLNNKVKKITR